MVSAARVFVTRAVIALAFAVPIIAAEQRPAFALQSGVLSVSLPASVLENATVKKHLASGLTTTFLLAARSGNGTITGARIEVRYDLWDEVWLVRRVEFDGRNDRQRIATREAFERWWHSPLRLLDTSPTPLTMQLELSVLPFSAAEEADARQWIAKSGGVGTAGGGGGIVDALIGTTLSAKPVTTFRWNVELKLP
jgi:hypothetical protein